MDLYPFQRVGAEWLAARRRAILGDVMGLGKSPQAIRAADLAGARRVAIVCPAIARVNWLREFARWTVYAPELKIASYNALAADRQLRKEWAAWRPDVLIADEAHYLKTADSRRTKSLYGPHCRGDGLVSCAGAFWALSGTIAPNHLGEMYPHLRALWPALLPGGGSYVEFLQRYTYWKPGTYGIDVMGNNSRTLPEIRAALAPHLLRRTPDQVAPDLPPVILGELVVDAGDARASLRDMEQSQEVRALRHKLDAGEPPPDSDPHLAAYRRVCGVAKARAVAAQVAEELDDRAYQKIVLFAHHRDVIEILESALQPYGAVTIHGGTSDVRRNLAIDRFQEEASCRVFIGQIQAASTAVNLNSAHQCILVESSWTPADNEQAIYRLRRGLQKSKVHVRMATLADSIDEAIQTVLARKTRALLELHED